MSESLLIRADATAEMGAGHVMRCLALAQAWQSAAGPASFLSYRLPPALLSRLRAEGFETESVTASPGSDADAAETARRAHELGTKWIVIDGYQFGGAYQQSLKRRGSNLLAVDDYGHADHYFADLVLNQELDAPESLYKSREPGTRLLLGCEYSLLRREFWRWRGWRRQISDRASKVLVTMGGGDAGDSTSKVVAALRQLNRPDLQVRIVIGPINPHRKRLERELVSDTMFRLVTATTEMPELMAWADIAIAGAGSTCWELLFMGLPSLVLIQAENQRGIAERLHNAGVAINLGWGADAQPAIIAECVTKLMESNATRMAMSRKGSDLVDGRGPERVMELIRNSDEHNG